MKMGRVLVSLGALAIMCMELAMAANYTVGGTNGGWDQSTDLATWASSLTFVEGDSLIFQYTPNHDVTEVSKPDFDSCSVSNPLQPPHTGGLSVVPLPSAGTRFFICGTGGHCLGGMKLQIDTIAASAPPPTTTPSPPPATASPPPKSPTPSPPPSTTTPPPKSTTPAPPPKIATPSPPPKSAPPKSSPPSKVAGDNTTSPPPSAPPPSASLSPPSSAARFDVISSLTACSGFALVMFLNL